MSSHTLARTLEEDTSYQLDNFVINSFANVKYLSPQKSDSPCDIHAIADIGTVDNTEPLSSNTVIANAEVMQMQRSLECHTLEHTMHVFHAKQRWIHLMMSVPNVPCLSKCDKQLSAKLVISTPNSNYTLVAFLPISYDQENSRRRHDHQFNKQTRTHHHPNSYG